MFSALSPNLSLVCALALPVLLVSGCGSATGNPDSPQTVPVSGVIKLDEKPLPCALVTFIPQTAEQGVECVGMTDAEGRYRLKQIRGKEGAPVGSYTVVVSSLVDGKGQRIQPGGDLTPADHGANESLPPRYSSYSDSKLTATVPAEGGEIEFALKSKK